MNEQEGMDAKKRERKATRELVAALVSFFPTIKDSMPEWMSMSS